MFVAGTSKMTFSRSSYRFEDGSGHLQLAYRRPYDGDTAIDPESLTDLSSATRAALRYPHMRQKR